MRLWFVRFLGPWWGYKAPRATRLNVLVGTVEAQGITREVSAQETTREVLGQTPIARTVREVI